MRTLDTVPLQSLLKSYLYFISHNIEISLMRALDTVGVRIKEVTGFPITTT